MPNITPTVSINIEKELANLDLYKYHPNGIINLTLNRLTDMLDGKVEIVEPSNPFTYLLETSCLNTAFAIQEYTLLTRKLYPRLANTENDLYLHMSDRDYLGRFTEPAFGYVKFNILFNDFTNKAVYDPIQKEYVLKLPRHLKITVDKYIFTLMSAIIIRKTENGIIDIKFENQTFNNIFPVETNYINFNILKVNQEETYINFDIKMPEVDIEPLELPIEKSKLFKNTVTFNPKRQFYYFRAFYYLDSVWKEMLVTHTDEVYDINTPTTIIKVLPNTSSIEYYIPPVYINNNMLGSKVKFLIYTTIGNININFSDYKIADFISEYNPIFPETELDNYTEALQLITKVIYLQDQIIAGKNGIEFNDLKTSVINNSIGDRQLPITNKQLEFLSEQNNFKLIKNVDIITNRVFLLELTIPNATTRYPITKINLDLIEYRSSVAYLRENGSGVTYVGNYITIIPETTLFKLSGGGIDILSKLETDALSVLTDAALTNEINNNTYISTLYHYILDTSEDETKLRAYDLSSPSITSINFKEFNATARVGINTTNTNIFRTSTGFTIDLLANLKKYVDNVSQTNITPYLIFTDNDSSKFYLEGVLFTDINNQPVYRFYLESNLYIDKDNKINITNFRDNNNIVSSVFLDLTSKLEIIYISNIIPPNYVPSTIDNYIYNSYLAVSKSAVTLEEINIIFGYYLEYLYSQVHTSTGSYDYQTYDEDVPLRYTSTVYNADNTIAHIVNEIVLDDEGSPIIEYKIGDIKIGTDNKPIPINELELQRYINLLFIDYKAVLASKTTLKDYRNYIRSYITENVVTNSTVIQKELLENTVAYVTVPKKINNINVKTPSRVVNLTSMQSFIFSVHVTERIYNDINARENISYTVINETDKYLYNNNVITKTQLLDILYNKLKEFVKSISLDKFTLLDEEYLEVVDPNSRISLNKILTVEADGYNMVEDITVNYILVS